jgi:hypothetical protein
MRCVMRRVRTSKYFTERERVLQLTSVSRVTFGSRRVVVELRGGANGPGPGTEGVWRVG